METTTLYFTKDGSDKVYQAAIVQSGERFLVNFNYGRRGATMQTGSKPKMPVSITAARILYNKLIEEKKAKGYTTNPDGVPQMPAVKICTGSSGDPASKYVVGLGGGDGGLVIPSFPARPTNGGDLTLAPAKIGRWAIEPKYNGWRALVHLPTGTMFNRHGKRLSIEKEFASAIAVLRDALASVADWIDTEALERRHGIGRGTLMVFDFLPLSDRSFIYPERRHHLSALPVLIADEQPAHHHAYLVPSWEMRGEKSLGSPGCQPPLIPSSSSHLWHRLQELNRQWNTTGLNSFYEGLVMKRVESPYPLQLRSAEDETQYWMKHRWPVL